MARRNSIYRKASVKTQRPSSMTLGEVSGEIRIHFPNSATNAELEGLLMTLTNSAKRQIKDRNDSLTIEKVDSDG